MKQVAVALAFATGALANPHAHSHGGHHKGAKFEGEALTTFEFTCPSDFILGVDELGKEVCTRTVEVSANTRCPAGFKKLGGSGSTLCQSSQTSTPIATCPSGFIRKHNECVATATSSLEQFCPPGYEITADGTCSKTEEVLPSPVCPPGLIADAVGNCVGRQIASVELECPEGFVESTLGCTQTESSPSELVCPTGFEQDGDNCVKLETTTPRTSCPPGTSLEDGQCTTSQSVAPQNDCPTDFVGPDEFGVCTFRELETPEQFCPEGSTLVGNKCETPMTVPFIPFCPVGTSLVGDECQLETTSAAVFSCPDGFTLKQTGAPAASAHHNKRHRRHAKTPAPPVPMESVCTAVEEVSVDFFCPIGFEDAGDECTREEINAPVESCPEGSKGFGTECIILDTATPTKICPNDFTLNALTDKCESLEFAELNIECPPGYTMSELQAPDGGMLCELCAPSKKATADCSYKPGLLVCPAGFQKNAAKTECSRLNSVAPTAECPIGFEATYQTSATLSAKGKRHHHAAKGDTNEVLTCTSSTVLSPEASCPSGTTSDGNVCVSTTSVPKVQRCPEGFSPLRLQSSKHGHHGDGGIQSCSRVVTEAVISTCPEGSTADPTQEDLCVSTTVSSQESRCPPGYISSAAECVRTNVSPALLRCPEEFVLANALECVRSTTEPATPSCPNGFTLTGNVCVFSSTGDVIESCPVGFQQVNGACERETILPAITRCPTGFSLQPDGTCESTVTASLTETCPEGFTLERQVQHGHARRHGHGHKEIGQLICVAQLSSEAETACPIGFVITADNTCQKVTVVAPSSRCPAGAHMKHGVCTTKESVTPEVACPEGFEMIRANVRGSHHHHHASGMSCVLEATAEIEPFCVDGSLPVGGVCTITRSVPATKVAVTVINTLPNDAIPTTTVKKAHGGHGHQKKVHMKQDGGVHGKH